MPAGFPEKWRSAVLARLGSAPVQAWLELDLDDTLRFAAGLLVVTADELWALEGEGAQATLRHWALDQDIAMLSSDHNGVGLLELVQGGHRITAWRYTLGAHVQASRLLEQFEARREFLLHGRPLQLSP
ncbi:MAG: ABC-type multidrug transport system, ATPase and permease component protein, partial [Pseudomonadota bacterium]